MKVHVVVKFKNTDEFVALTKKFTQKAHELERIVHELENFNFDVEVAPSTSSVEAD